MSADAVTTCPACGEEWSLREFHNDLSFIDKATFYVEVDAHCRTCGWTAKVHGCVAVT